MSFFDDAITTLGQGLAQTAIQAATDETGYDVGGALNVLFGNGQTTGGQDITVLIGAVNNSNLSQPFVEQIQNSLTQQVDLLAALGTQLNALSQQISGLNSAIAGIQAMLQKIDKEILYTQWEIVDTDITNFLTSINVAYGQYSTYLAQGIGVNQQTGPVADLCAEILSANNGAGELSAAISQLLIDDDQRKGVLQLWTAMIVPLISDNLIDFREAADKYFTYYQRMAYAQLQATNLAMEAYNFQGSSDLAKNMWSSYRNQLIAHENCFITWLMPLIAAGVQRIEDPSNPHDSNSLLAVLQLNPSAWTGSAPYYQPSSLLQRAEQILADLYVTEPTDRRVVVHMLNDAGPWIENVVASAPVSISLNNGEPVLPSRSYSMPRYTLQSGNPGDPIIDENFYSNAFYLRRYVFETLPTESGPVPILDGVYGLTNLNGRDGLVPIETYTSFPTTVPFMDAGPLGYPMTVSSQSPFAFANFLAYYGQYAVGF